MDFVNRIINEGFVEQWQKRLLELRPNKEKWIPRWWEKYDTSYGWFGLSADYPDSFFRKDGEDKELQLSLQGIQTGFPESEEDKILMQNKAVRYICMKVGTKIIYETFSGKIPSEEIVTNFLERYE